MEPSNWTRQSDPINQLNDMIKKVKKKEVHGQGQKSTARRPNTGDEYRHVVEILKEEGTGIAEKYGVPAHEFSVADDCLN